MVERKKHQKLFIVIVVLIVVAVIACISGFTYAYLARVKAKPGVTVGTIGESEDQLIFRKDEDLAINVSSDNFGLSDGNLIATVKPTVTLIANKHTKIATRTYYSGIKITKNTFVKTDNQAELILTVKKGDQVIENCGSLVTRTVNGVTGFDITRKIGTFVCASNEEIKSTNSDEGVTDVWTYTVTFINKDYDQVENETAEFNATAILQEEEIIDKDALGNLCKDKNLAECFIQNYKNDSTIVYHDGKADYTGMKNYSLEAEDLSYRYSGASEEVNNYVCFGNDDETCPDNNLYRIIGFFKNNDTAVYETKLIKADYANKDLLGSGTTNPSTTPDYNTNGTLYSSVYNKTSENSEEQDAFVHRYRGSLSEVNRYRYQENGTQDTKANWPTALLNIIHLNHNFLGTFTSTWQNKIVDYNWHYKGNSYSNIVIGNKTSKNTIRTAYDYEVGSKADTTLTEPTKIGLMYVSDYLYAASPNNWSLKPYNGTYTYVSGDPDSEGNPQGTYDETDGTDYRSAIDENWMYMGLWEWTITQRTDASAVSVFRLLAPGIIRSTYSGTGTNVVRPCFYLSSNVQIKGGYGSKANPYRIA